jgi:16S rRNA (guanine527-N7)-methyltransferase
MLGLPLSPHVVARLVLYLKELLRWNAKTNLTGMATETEIITKQFLDSLAACKVFDPRPGLRLLDIGTGAGFPGLVLKLHAPDLAVTLLEPSTKKAAFLHYLIGLLGVPSLPVATSRIEDFKEQGFHLVTSRAVKAEVITAAAPRLLAPGGRVLLYRVSPMLETPPDYTIVRQASFTLPFTDVRRTVTLLKLTTDVSPSEFTAFLIR